jgi:hypothetical protein
MAIGEKTLMMNDRISIPQICDAIESMGLIRQDTLFGVTCTEQVFLRSGASESLQRLLLVDAPSLHGDAALPLEIVKKPE